jgi:hypothetical protein
MPYPNQLISFTHLQSKEEPAFAEFEKRGSRRQEEQTSKRQGLSSARELQRLAYATTNGMHQMIMQIGLESRTNKKHLAYNPVRKSEQMTRYHGPGVDSSEMLIVDVRGQLCPAEQVERKLKSLLGETSVPLSHLRMRASCMNR